ncbi:Golgi membrane exchange factor (Ric1p-Rgp1p) subunit [Microbotryomycetes sp. JL221]|nr:Golgi membrane exchange factor (Ric1p-Rgp1p) subunit [Microbotryomycetes sp. JL221]
MPPLVLLTYQTLDHVSAREQFGSLRKDRFKNARLTEDYGEDDMMLNVLQFEYAVDYPDVTDIVLANATAIDKAEIVAQCFPMGRMRRVSTEARPEPARAPKPGLVVNVEPGASAFFAGEVFTATITFKNTHPQVQAVSVTQDPLSLPPGLNKGPYGNPRAASSSSSSSLTAAAPPPPIATTATWSRNPSASSSSSSTVQRVQTHSRRPSFQSSTNLLAPTSSHAKSQSSFFGFGGGSSSHTRTQPNMTNRSVSSVLPSSAASTSGGTGIDNTTLPEFPTRKGLIGRPLPPAPVVEPAINRSINGLYSGGPRRPGRANNGSGLGNSHTRSQSMAMSSPNLVHNNNNNNINNNNAEPQSMTKQSMLQRAHSRNRLGGSMAAPQWSTMMSQRHSSSTATSLTGQGEESGSYMNDAAFPPAASSNLSGSNSSPINTARHYLDSPNDHEPSTSLQRHPSRTMSTLNDESDSDGSDYDPSDSQASLPGQGFYGLGRNETMDDFIQTDFETRTKSTTTATTMMNHKINSQISNVPPVSIPRPNSAASRNQYFHPTNTISLLWSFAHLEGSFEVDDSLIKTNEFMRLKKELVTGQGAAVGGGTLNESRLSIGGSGLLNRSIGRSGILGYQGPNGINNGGSGGWRDWLWGGNSSTKSLNSNNSTGAASLEERKQNTMLDKTVPTFSTPPSILAVDLILEPGQSKTYTFSIRIPADLPPSFRGRSIKFNYNLVVGTSRTKLGTVTSPAAALGAARDATSRVMRVPIRVYNHVGVTGARPFYDLTNPIVYHRDEAIISAINRDDNGNKSSRSTQSRKLNPKLRADGRREFEQYASNLLDSVATNSPEMIATAMSPELKPLQSPVFENQPPSLRPERQSRTRATTTAIGGGGEDDDEGGCKAAVEIVTRNSQKVSYDINKDGYLVSKLTLVKSAYRLGETVNGSVVINSGEGRVLRVSARLETHELVETTISTRTANQIRQTTRRLHAEHHETTLDSARIGFALAIPSGATPDFGTSGVKLQWSVRLSFLVIPPSPEAPMSNPNLTLTERDRVLTHNRTTPTSTTTSGSRHGRSKSFAYGFEPAVPLTLPPPPMITPTGAVHLMPVGEQQHQSIITTNGGTTTTTTIQSHTCYRAVPDLGYVPVMFKSNAPEPPPLPGPLQRSASGARGMQPQTHRSTNSLSLARQQVKPEQTGSVVLVPAKVDVVECSIPIKVYPGNTPFKPTTSIFAA